MSKIDHIINGMLTLSAPSNYWMAPDRSFPELEVSRAIIQRNGQSVWEHTMSVIDILEIKNHVTLLSGLFHDLGKGSVTILNDPSLPRFPGHADESASIAEVRLAEWGASPLLIDSVVRLVSTHMFDISNVVRDRTIRKFVADIGTDNVNNWFALRVADSCSYASQHRYYSHFIKPFRKSVMAYLQQQPGTDTPKFSSPDQMGNIQIEGGDS